MWRDGDQLTLPTGGHRTICGGPSATELLAAGVDSKTAQTWLGHSDARFTLHLDAQAVMELGEAAARRMGTMFDLTAPAPRTVLRPVAYCLTESIREGEGATMRRAFVVLVVAMLASLGTASMASAQNQPGQGETSEGRNVAGFGGGPHCHVLVVESAQSQFDFIQVFPSHTAHEHSGLSGGVFMADGNCDGVP